MLFSLGTSIKNFQTTKYSLFFQEKGEYREFLLLKFFRKTLRSNLNLSLFKRLPIC